MSQINTISTLNSTVVKKRETQEEIEECGRFCKKKMVREPAFCEHDCSFGVSNMDGLCGDCVGWGSSEGCGEGNMTLNQYTMLGKCT
jgi:hypothetical protein